MQESRQSTTAAMAEQLVEIGILALKGFIFMLWVQSMASPFQFLVGGLLILAAAYLLSSYPRLMTRASRRSTQMENDPRNGNRKSVRFHESVDGDGPKNN